MALTYFEAMKTFQNPLAVTLFKGVVTEDPLFAMVPMVPIAGSAFSYQRIKDLATMQWIGQSDATTSSNTDFDLLTVPKRTLNGDLDINNFVLANQDGGSQLFAQAFGKGRATARALGQAMITGTYATSVVLGDTDDPFAAAASLSVGPLQDSDLSGLGSLKYVHVGTFWSYRAPGDRVYGPAVAVAANDTVTLVSDNPNKTLTLTITVLSATKNGTSDLSIVSTTKEPDGLQVLTTASQTRDSTGVNGDALSFEIMDEVVDQLKIKDQAVILMPLVLIRKLKALYRNLGGTTPMDVSLPSFGTSGATVMKPVLTYDGIPVLPNEWIPKTEVKGANSNLASIYATSLTTQSGAGPDNTPAGFFWGTFGGASMQVDADPTGRIVLGLQMVDVGQREAANEHQWRVNFYGGMGLGSVFASSRAREIQTV